MITKKTYIITRNMTNLHEYHVEASSKSEALRMVEDGEVWSEEQCFMRETKPMVINTITYDTCPNKGEAWSDIPLDKLVLENMGGFGWHYNSRCDGEKESTKGHCGKCSEAMRVGMRLLTNAEKVYLKNQYGECRNLNTEE